MRFVWVVNLTCLMVLLTSCGPSGGGDPTPTPPFTPILTATHTLTEAPTLTNTSTLIPTPIYMMFGSPFASDCGDGVPVIWSNDSFNGPFRPDKFGDHWGHVDWFVPEGCNIDTYNGEIIAPITGRISAYSYGYKFSVPQGSYLTGIEDALKFAGIENPDIRQISLIELDIGHVDIFTGTVTQGQIIGDAVWAAGHPQIAYQIIIVYQGTEYMLSPTLFPHLLSDGTILRPMLYGTSENWICAKDSYAVSYQNLIYDCIPEQNDYAP